MATVSIEQIQGQLADLEGRLQQGLTALSERMVSLDRKVEDVRLSSPQALESEMKSLRDAVDIIHSCQEAQGEFFEEMATKHRAPDQQGTMLDANLSEVRK